MSNQQPQQQTPKPQPQPAQKQGGDRKPIPVGLLQFVQPGQDGPGLSMSTSVTSRKLSRGSRHEMDFRPWMRAFRLTHYPANAEPRSVYIPEQRVALWEPLEE